MEQSKDKVEPGVQITLLRPAYNTVIEHCRRKLSEDYIDSEARGKKAYGVFAGTESDTDIIVESCFPLLKNVRNQQPYKDFLDQLMEKHAIRSETPLEKRGWVADPDEWAAITDECKGKNQALIGTYHMHRVGWDHDQKRDTPTELDEVMGEKSGMYMFIISMVKPEKPIIRAFFEGDITKETPVILG